MELQEKLNQLDAAIDQKVKQANEQVLLSVKENGKMIEDSLKSELANMLTEHKELSQKQYDELQTSIKKAGGFSNQGPESFEQMLAKGLDENKGKLHAKKNGADRLDFTLAFDQKAVGDMLVGTSLGTGVMQPNLRAGVVERQAYFNHVRDFMTVRPTSSPIIHYIQENGGEGSPTTVAEGALKPQIDYDLVLKTAEIKKIAAHLRLSEEMIEDVPYITNYVTTRGAEDLRLVEDAQILYGSGTGSDLRGLNLDAVAFARPAGIGTIANATIADIVRVAMAQIRIGRYRATAIMLNPIDVAVLELTKDAQGGYLFVNTANQGAVSTIWRLPIIETDAVTAGSFFIGDFTNGAELYDRKALNVRFYDQDRDNAIRNMVTIVIEERLGLATIRPASFVKGTFAAARTALAAA
ncbi:phage major capsid protein [Nibribacter koreensis]|uniref:Phage major capsid protein n=1 Tax=Nibribacter koreensis TaxID=1084519 RepID=A0ABP8FBS1_9BACT